MDAGQPSGNLGWRSWQLEILLFVEIVVQVVITIRIHVIIIVIIVTSIILLSRAEHSV